MGEYKRWGTLHPAGLPAHSVSTHQLTKAVSALTKTVSVLTNTISELTKSLWEKLWWHPLSSPIRGITTERLHKLCCSCSTSSSSPCPLCSSVHQDSPQTGKTGSPKQTLVLLFVLWPYLLDLFLTNWCLKFKRHCIFVFLCSCELW